MVSKAAASTDVLVFLVRHAEPAGPGGKRFLGHADPPLSREGERQARLLGARLARFDAVHSSDLGRCMQTAEIIVSSQDPPAMGLPVTPHEWLREIDVGLWQGLTWEEAKERYPAEHAQRELDLVGYPFPGGESFQDLQNRVVPHFLDLVQQESRAGHHRILVVGHKGVNRVLLAHAFGLPLQQIFSVGQDYCAASVLRVSSAPGGEWRLIAESRS